MRTVKNNRLLNFIKISKEKRPTRTRMDIYSYCTYVRAYDASLHKI